MAKPPSKVFVRKAFAKAMINEALAQRAKVAILRCPKCQGRVKQQGTALTCQQCGRQFAERTFTRRPLV